MTYPVFFVSTVTNIIGGTKQVSIDSIITPLGETMDHDPKKFWFRVIVVLIVVVIIEFAVDKALGITYDNVSFLAEQCHKAVRLAGGMAVGAALFHRS